MKNSELEEAVYASKNNANVTVLAFAVVAVVLVLAIMLCINTYAVKKQEVLRTLDSEGALLETFCHEIFDHNLYVISLLARSIQTNPKDLKYINSVFKHYSSGVGIRELFAWKEFLWLDDNFIPRVSGKSGIIHEASPLEIDQLSKSKKEPGKIFYWSDLATNPSNTALIYTAMGVNDEEGNYVGSIVVSYDVRVLNANFRRHKEHDYTNLVLIDRDYQVVMQSKTAIAGIGIENGMIVDHHIADFIRRISTKNDNSTAVSYLDMVNGVNFHIKKVTNEPFILLTNIDRDEIRNTILHSMIMRFLEISIFASIFLILIITIYKRETWLRSKTERAYRIALNATSAKSDFLAFTAHEIRSPLGFILTGSEMMCKEIFGQLPQEYHEYAKGINKNANLILEFISDILDVEHIIAGNFKIVNTVNDVAEMIEIAVKHNQTLFSARNIDIVQDIANNLPKLLCDARRIMQVINNIISNSIKYSLDNTTVTITTKVDRGDLVIRIEDQGVGMSEDEMKIALTKYGTVRKQHFNFIESYGLGLAIVKLLLDVHEASFMLESEEKVGTIATITFPKNKLVYS